MLQQQISFEQASLKASNQSQLQTEASLEAAKANLLDLESAVQASKDALDASKELISGLQKQLSESIARLAAQEEGSRAQLGAAQAQAERSAAEAERLQLRALESEEKVSVLTSRLQEAEGELTSADRASEEANTQAVKELNLRLQEAGARLRDSEASKRATEIRLEEVSEIAEVASKGREALETQAAGLSRDTESLWSQIEQQVQQAADKQQEDAARLAAMEASGKRLEDQLSALRAETAEERRKASEAASIAEGKLQSMQHLAGQQESVVRDTMAQVEDLLDQNAKLRATVAELTAEKEEVSSHLSIAEQQAKQHFESPAERDIAGGQKAVEDHSLLPVREEVSAEPSEQHEPERLHRSSGAHQMGDFGGVLEGQSSQPAVSAPHPVISSPQQEAHHPADPQPPTPSTVNQSHIQDLRGAAANGLPDPSHSRESSGNSAAASGRGFFSPPARCHALDTYTPNLQDSPLSLMAASKRSKVSPTSRDAAGT